MRRILLSFVLPCGMLASTFAAPPSRPNVILLITDDQGYGGYGDVSTYHESDVRTPNIRTRAAPCEQPEIHYTLSPLP